MTTLNAVELEAKVREVAQKHPDTVYRSEVGNPSGQRCLYKVTESNPMGCIVGEAARRLGESLDGHLSSVVILGDRGAISGDVSWLVHVQHLQDAGDTWRDAVETADNARDYAKFDHPVVLTRWDKLKGFFSRRGYRGLE